MGSPAGGDEGMAKAGIALLGVLVAMALAAGLYPHPPDMPSGPPLAAPDRYHLLGTDDLGVDVLAQVCHGARVSLAVSLATAVLAGGVGGGLGAWAGYVGGWADALLMRVVDAMLVLPALPLVMLLAAMLGPGLDRVVLVLAVLSWPRPARVVRAQVLSLRERLYVRAARFYGAGTWYMLRRHLIPEVAPLLGASMVKLAGHAVVAEASLAFLGLGDPSLRSWGSVLYHATRFPGLYLTPYWRWWMVGPWVALTALVVALALLGLELDRVAHPRLRHGAGTDTGVG